MYRLNFGILSILIISLSLGVFSSSSAHAKRTSYITIGTGGVTGVYYPTGGAIAKIINKGKKKHGIRASVESTGGSVYNVNAVMSGDLEFGVVQSDRQFQAMKGLAEWKSVGPQKNLRSVFSLHAEAITLVAAKDKKVKTLKDLKGKKVNIGNPGSGHRGNSIDVLTTAGINWKEEIRAESLKASEAPKMLQDDRIDAFFYTVGHPSGAIKEATSGKRKVQFIAINGMDRLLQKFPYYAKTAIPVSEYPMAANKKDVETIGVVATLVTSSKVSTHAVYEMTKAIFKNLDQFRKLHPALKRLNKKAMISNGLSAPLHPGAEKYYREIGLLK